MPSLLRRLLSWRPGPDARIVEEEERRRGTAADDAAAWDESYNG